MRINKEILKICHRKKDESTYAQILWIGSLEGFYFPLLIHNFIFLNAENVCIICAQVTHLKMGMTETWITTGINKHKQCSVHTECDKHISEVFFFFFFI